MACASLPAQVKFGLTGTPLQVEGGQGARRSGEGEQAEHERYARLGILFSDASGWDRAGSGQGDAVAGLVIIQRLSV